MGIKDIIDTYYLIDKKSNNNFLRLRDLNGKQIFSYKKKIDDSHYEKYDVLIDNAYNLNIISVFYFYYINILFQLLILLHYQMDA